MRYYSNSDDAADHAIFNVIPTLGSKSIFIRSLWVVSCHRPEASLNSALWGKKIYTTYRYA